MKTGSADSTVHQVPQVFDWGTFHAHKRRRTALAQERRAPQPAPFVLDFDLPSTANTFVPGRAAPIYSQVGPNGTLVPLPSPNPRPAVGVAGPSHARQPTTATHRQPPSKVVARYQKKFGGKSRDPDEELLARLVASRAKQEAEAKAKARKRRKYICIDGHGLLFAHFLATSMSTPQFHCEVPYFADPGQPMEPSPSQKLYLVTGGPSVKAGAYGTWNTAGHMSQGRSDALVQSYGPHERDVMRAAWRTGCRAPHSSAYHGALLYHPHASLVPIPQPDPEDNIKHKIVKVGDEQKVVRISSRSPSPTSTHTHSLGSSGARPSGEEVYAVRSGKKGWVYADLEDVRRKFHALQRGGHSVQLATRIGFTDAVNFAEHRAPGHFVDGDQHIRWAEEEQQARAHLLREEREHAKYREELIGHLEVYREGESEHESDDSDASRATQDLETELKLRESKKKEPQPRREMSAGERQEREEEEWRAHW
ncbi:hypothetical protein FB451DRAFT_1199226 [Mycena latifolia]|nr:hypothetical protein FB451DRAFT_1199226 [Mycena latifolia]